MATCIPYLHEQLALVRPRVIVALGNTAVAALLDTKLGITKVRGPVEALPGQTLVMPTYHPSYLLRPSPQQAEAKRQAWEDLQLVMKELGLRDVAARAAAASRAARVISPRVVAAFGRQWACRRVPWPNRSTSSSSAGSRTRAPLRPSRFATRCAEARGQLSSSRSASSPRSGTRPT